MGANNSRPKYKFYWQSNSFNENRNLLITWEPFIEVNQILLNHKYQENNSNKNVELNFPENYFKVDFSKMKMLHIHENKQIPIKFEEFQENLSAEKFPNEGEEFAFFWQSNPNPLDHKEKPTWSPYELEDQCFLKKEYQKYLNDNTYKSEHLIVASDYYIDFSKNIQINLKNQTQQRTIQRCNPNEVKDIIRTSRFEISENSKISKDSNYQVNFIHEKTVKKQDEVGYFLKKSDEIKFKKINKIQLKVFKDFECTIEIDTQLCPFDKENYIIDISLDELKQKLIEEIKYLRNDNKKFSESNSLYISHLNQIIDYKSFFQKIVYIYTMEGFIYKNMNDYLRALQINEIKNIKYYYISLLASLLYFSQNCHQLPINSPLNNDLILYRVTRVTDLEFDEYKKKDFKNIYRVYNEFLSTSSSRETALNYLINKDSNIKEFIWEITIPYHLIKNGLCDFADISNYSYFQNEKEYLLRSGTVLKIDDIIPYQIENGNQLVEIPNIFIKKCTIKAFSIASFFEIISLDPSIKHLELDNLKLGDNPINMLYIKEILVGNDKIEELDVRSNNLGLNEENIFYLIEPLKNSKKILKLDLSSNNLGSNMRIIEYLKDIIINNKSILEFDLNSNNLGENHENMEILKEAFVENETIQKLYLHNNNLGKLESNFIILREILEKTNRSIKELSLQFNNISEEKKTILKIYENIQIYF